MRGDLKGHKVKCYRSYPDGEFEMGWASRKEMSKEKRQKRKEGLSSSICIFLKKKVSIYMC